MPVSDPAPLASPSLAPSPRDRLSGSAWLFARSGGTSALAPGGSLGGSQLGGRVAYRLNDDTRRPLALSGRIYAPLDHLEGAEVAVGVDWKPLADLPLHLLVERRQALGEDGRSALSATAYGGVSEQPVGPLRVDGYVQAGVVGLRSKDLFVDGSVKLGLPMGDVKIGAGVWAAAQPGVSRVDIGPQASAHVPGTDFVVSADWRLRVAGDAVPDSGPTVTLAVDF